MRKRILGLLVLAGAAGLAGLALQRGRRGGATGPVERQSRMARNAEIARVSTRVGGTYAVHQARRVFASAQQREQLDTAFELKSAEQVAAALGNMKGAMMKVGQMASYLDAGLPPHVREALGQLQQDAPPMSPSLAAAVIESELGAPPEVVFAEWDERPIASASIGQVHRAMTREGRAVAVKVQYPGVARAIEADLGNLGLVCGGMGMLFPGMDPEPIVAELRERLVDRAHWSISPFGTPVG